MSCAQVFISYASADKAFADRLQSDLVSIGISVWKDDKIRPGDDFSSLIEEAINRSDYFFFILSVNSNLSSWVEIEYRLALILEAQKDKPVIVPIRLHDVELPLLLRRKQYVDFVNDYASGWTELAKLFPVSDLRALRLGGGTGTGIYLLKLFIAKFREKFPELPVEERVNISRELIQAVASEGIDNKLDAAVVGLMPEGTATQAVEYQEVVRDSSVLTVFPGHPLWGTESISEEDLHSVFRDDTVLISRPKGSGLYEAAMNYLEPRLGRNRADTLLERFVAYDLDSVRRFVSEGRGISIMPNIIVNQDVLSGKMWAVRLPGDVDRPFYGVWAKARRRSSVAEEFIALLKEGLDDTK